MIRYPSYGFRHHRYRRYRRFILFSLIVSFLLLPWLFVAKMPSAQQWRNDAESAGFLPVPVGAAVPLPSTAPTILQYWPIPVGAVQSWIEQTDPGALAGQPPHANIIQAAITAGRRDNINPLLLLGILNAEQSFLSPHVAGGMAHAQLFTGNPWDYGVYPGSPFAFDIGPTQSAIGAATIVDEVALAVIHHGWSWKTFKLDLAKRYAQNWQPWVHITFSTWSTMQTNPSIAAGILSLVLQNPTSVPDLHSLGSKTLTQVAGIAVPGSLLMAKIITVFPKIQAFIANTTQSISGGVDTMLEDVGVSAGVAGDVGEVAAVVAEVGMDAAAVATAA